jgi:hypothetical protein
MAASAMAAMPPMSNLAMPRRFGGAGGPFMWVLPPLEVGQGGQQPDATLKTAIAAS